SRSGRLDCGDELAGDALPRVVPHDELIAGLGAGARLGWLFEDLPYPRRHLLRSVAVIEKTVVYVLQLRQTGRDDRLAQAGVLEELDRARTLGDGNLAEGVQADVHAGDPGENLAVRHTSGQGDVRERLAVHASLHGWPVTPASYQEEVHV